MTVVWQVRLNLATAKISCLRFSSVICCGAIASIGYMILSSSKYFDIYSEQWCRGAGTRANSVPTPFRCLLQNEFEAVLKWLVFWVRYHIFLLAVYP